MAETPLFDDADMAEIPETAKPFDIDGRPLKGNSVADDGKADPVGPVEDHDG